MAYANTESTEFVHVKSKRVCVMASQLVEDLEVFKCACVDCSSQGMVENLVIL